VDAERKTAAGLARCTVDAAVTEANFGNVGAGPIEDFVSDDEGRLRMDPSIKPLRRDRFRRLWRTSTCGGSKATRSQSDSNVPGDPPTQAPGPGLAEADAEKPLTRPRCANDAAGAPRDWIHLSVQASQI